MSARPSRRPTPRSEMPRELEPRSREPEHISFILERVMQQVVARQPELAREPEPVDG